MSLSFDKESPARREDRSSYSQPALSPQPTASPGPMTDLSAMQSSIGNAALASTSLSTPPVTSSNAFQFQSTFGNAAVLRETELQAAQQPVAPAVEGKTVNPPAPAVSLTPVITAPSKAEPSLTAPPSTYDASARQSAASLPAGDKTRALSSYEAQPTPEILPEGEAKPAAEPATEPITETGEKAATEAQSEIEAKPKAGARPEVKAGASAEAAAGEPAAGGPKAAGAKEATKATAKAESPRGEGVPGSAEGKAEAAAAPDPSEAIAPAITGVHQRARAARKHSKDASIPIGSAQAAAKSPTTEQTRGAAHKTVTDLGTAAKTSPEVKPDGFKELLKIAIHAATPEPKTESDAERVKKTGATDARGKMQEALTTQRDAAAQPLKSVPEADPRSQPVSPEAKLQPEPLGPPPVPASADAVVPKPLPAERLDYSSDREPTDRAMVENNITKEQLDRGNEPAFNQTLEARSEAEEHEAAAQARYRESESGVREHGQSAAEATLGKGLAGMYDARKLQIGNVVGRQGRTKDKDAAERQRITEQVNGIKNRTHEAVQNILTVMERVAIILFDIGLRNAEAAYAATFEEEKGGAWNWLTNWGSDWERLIETSLKKAREKYLMQIDATVDSVADYINAQLNAAKLRVTQGLREVETFVKGLDTSVQKFGADAMKEVSTDFEAMVTEIDQRRDNLVEKLTQQYKSSYERMSAMEERLREENKSLWQKIYDATIGLIKKILAFKDMLLSILAKAAEVILDIISDPIGFLSNLISTIMQGLEGFMSRIGEHLQKGLMEWLFGALGGAGLQLPEKFDLEGIVSIVLQVLGLTYANFRARAVAIVGEQVVAAIEKTAEVFKVIISEGIPGLWRFIKDQLADLKSMVLDAIFDFIKERVIIAGVTWIISLLNPASAFFKACKAIYDIVMFFINRGSQILALVNAVIDSVAAIAKGNLAAGAALVENALAKAIPVAIGLLASLLSLGDPSEPVKKIIEKAQAPVNKAIDWVINLAVKGVKALGKLLGFGKDEKEEKTTDPKDHVGMAEEVALKLQQSSEASEDYSALRKEKEEQAKQLETVYTAKLEPGIKLRILFLDQSKDISDDDLDIEIVIAPNDTRLKFARPIGGYPAPMVGSYSEMSAKGSSEPKLKDDKIREAHHAPPVELAISLSEALTTAGNELRSDDEDAADQILIAASNLAQAARSHGNDLPAILVHQDTHRTAGGKGVRIHGSEIRKQLKDSLESEGYLEYVPTTVRGDVAVKPGSAAFDRQLVQIAEKESGKRVSSKKALRAALKSHGREIVIAAYNAELERSLSAVEIAVSGSKVDGSTQGRKAALQELHKIAPPEWEALLSPIFPD